MESATPGIKSTSDGWLNRYLQARRLEAATPFRAVSLTAQLPRMLQGRAPALALSQVGTFGIRDEQGGDAMGASFEAESSRHLNEDVANIRDKVHRIDVLERAWQQVKANQGSPGVDAQTIEAIEAAIAGQEPLLDGWLSRETIAAAASVLAGKA